MRKASGLIIGLGLLLSLVASANTITTLRRGGSPCDAGLPAALIQQFFVVEGTANCEAAPLLAIPPLAADRQRVVVAPVLWPTSPPVIEPEPGRAPVLSAITAPAIGEQPDSVSVESGSTGSGSVDPGSIESGLNEAPAPVSFPERIVIPAIQLDAPVVAVEFEEVKYGQETYRQWEVPEYFAAGWHRTTAPLGTPGNTVLNGHHNFHGQVFAHLADLEVGDRILVYSGETAFGYAVALKLILPERDQPLEVRVANARWIQSSQDERLTLVTCWPYYSNTHRVIVVATLIGLPERGSHE